MELFKGKLFLIVFSVFIIVVENYAKYLQKLIKVYNLHLSFCIVVCNFFYLTSFNLIDFFLFFR